jgi:hypothetical protein
MMSTDEATLVEPLLKEKRKANWGDNNPKLTDIAVQLSLADGEKSLESCCKEFSGHRIGIYVIFIIILNIPDQAPARI